MRWMRWIIVVNVKSWRLYIGVQFAGIALREPAMCFRRMRIGRIIIVGYRDWQEAIKKWIRATLWFKFQRTTLKGGSMPKLHTLRD